METILLGIFITGYLLITLEHSLKIDKLIPALAMMAFFAINVIGIKTHGFHMLSLFLPPGAPLALAPLLVMIELVSSFSFRLNKAETPIPTSSFFPFNSNSVPF